MLIDEKIFASEQLSKKIEFQTLQSSERCEEEIRYKNVSRKMIVFDLRDTETMLEIGTLIEPHGIKENFANKLMHSSRDICRIWAEKKVVKRGKNLIRLLYLKHPEKFRNVEYENAKSKKMSIIKANYILSEVTSNKSISLKDDRTNELAQLKDFKNRFTGEAQSLMFQENIIKDLTQDDHGEKHNLLGMDQKEEE